MGKTNKKVEIIIDENDYKGNKYKFDESVYNGCEYTSVGFNGKNYGSMSPCRNDKEIKKSIENCKEWIIKEGDIPVIVDNREKAKLSNWF